MKRIPSHKSKSLATPSQDHPIGYQTHAFFSSALIGRFYKLIVLIIVIFSTVLNTDAQQYDSISNYIQQYEYQEAINQIDKIVNYSADLELIILKATALKGLNKHQEAIPYYVQIFKNDTSNLKSIVELANCYQSIGNYKNTQKLYSRALLINPQNNYLFQQLANSYYLDNDYKNALKYYLSAYSTDSSYYLSKQLAKCYDNLNKIDTAIFYYRKTVELNPVDFQSTYRLAGLYKQKEDYEKGIFLTDSFLEQDSTNIKMIKLNGFLYFLNKDFTKSTERFEQCIALSDTSDFVNKYLGYSYFKMEEFQKAKDYLEKAYQKDTTNIELCYVLGLSCDYSIYKKLGIEYLSKTVDLLIPSPTILSQVYQDLAAANTGYYKYEEALGAYLKAYELTPNDTLMIYKIASHCDNWIQDKNLALKYYQKFMTTRPKDRKPLPKMPVPGGIEISYYDFVERRMNEIKEELFWQGEKIDTTSLK